MDKKIYDPRSKLANPFVQAYVEKQAQKARPVGEAQTFVNVLLICGLAINFAVVLMVGWTATKQQNTIQVHADDSENQAMADAVLRIQQLEANLQTMRTAVEFHKNAYYKLESEHENMKAVVARWIPPESVQNPFANYPTPPTAPLDSTDSAPQDDPKAPRTTPVDPGRASAGAVTTQFASPLVGNR